MPQVPKAPFMYLLLAVLLVDTDQEIGPQTVRTEPDERSGTSAYRSPCTFGKPCKTITKTSMTLYAWTTASWLTLACMY
ncbi:hypothetical protein CCHR01_16857 [Colletotrichum chrysophilum]|uniref:Uncharacterized protein n=1 Tax=Colletotrichum chrysophilum TaxID=1836956 RepID=A0AAD9A4U1_9PEZI|nr:hypothetical protein CCHR01_16857 [Colletotrichum chrysophilum]